MTGDANTINYVLLEQALIDRWNALADSGETGTVAGFELIDLFDAMAMREHRGSQDIVPTYTIATTAVGVLEEAPDSVQQHADYAATLTAFRRIAVLDPRESRTPAYTLFDSFGAREVRQSDPRLTARGDATGRRLRQELWNKRDVPLYDHIVRGILKLAETYLIIEGGDAETGFRTNDHFARELSVLADPDYEYRGSVSQGETAARSLKRIIEYAVSKNMLPAHKPGLKDPAAAANERYMRRVAECIRGFARSADDRATRLLDDLEHTMKERFARDITRDELLSELNRNGPGSVRAYMLEKGFASEAEYCRWLDTWTAQLNARARGGAMRYERESGRPRSGRYSVLRGR